MDGYSLPILSGKCTIVHTMYTGRYRYLVGHITYKYIESRHFFRLPKSSHSKEDVERCYAQICMTCYYLLIHKHKKQTFADDVMLGIRTLFETLKNVYVAGKIYVPPIYIIIM